MSWLSDTDPLIAGCWISSAYSGHGVIGVDVPITGTNGASIISRATAIDPTKEYRLFAVSLPAGFTLNEDGSGIATVSGVAVLRMYENGIELP